MALPGAAVRDRGVLSPAGNRCRAIRVPYAMAIPADLETIAAKLAQADAILAYSGATGRRVEAVRALLRVFRADDMPTRATRAMWIQIVETMLNLGVGVVPLQEIDGLGLQIRQLRNAIRKHIAAVPA